MTSNGFIFALIIAVVIAVVVVYANREAIFNGSNQDQDANHHS